MTPTPNQQAEREALKPCPFCGCAMRIESNRDTHKLIGDHDDLCMWGDTDDPTITAPATPYALAALRDTWNRRAAPVAVPEWWRRIVLSLRDEDDSESPVSSERKAGWMAALDAVDEALSTAPTPQPAAEPVAQQELEKAHEARRQAQSELAYVKARLASARLVLMRELQEQGWTPPATPPAKPQPSELVAVPLQVLEAAREAIGNFCMDHGWSDADMQAGDNLDAYIAQHKAQRAALAKFGGAV